MAYIPYSKTLLASLLAITAGMAAATPEPARHQARIDKIVGEISPQRIEGYIRKLVGFQTRHTMSDTVSDSVGIGAARRWRPAAKTIRARASWRATSRRSANVTSPTSRSA
jgi:hypothetical protein